MDFKKRIRKAILYMLMIAMLCGGGSMPVQAAELSSLKDGTYSLDGSLSCYVPAMGGVEFGGPLLKGISVKISGGEATMTLSLRKSQVTIYSITCDTFISATEGKLGYHDKNGTFKTSGVSKSLSSDTAKNAAGEDVKYVVSMSFPLDQKANTYKLGLYVDSNVMGTQFGASGNYDAKLTVDWSSVPVVEEEEATTAKKEETTTAKKEETTTAKKEETTTSKKTETTTAKKEETTTSKKTETAVSTESKNTEQGTETTELADETTTEELTVKEELTSESLEEATEAEVEVVEKDGLNIHYANGENQGDETEESSSILWVAGAAVAAAVIAAVVFYNKKKRG